MCRLFGFRSIFSSQVHSSLVSADNALVQQSERHPDGWGVAYYLADTPHLIKSSSSAVSCQLFHKVSGVVSSQTVLAHLRSATIGPLDSINTHPFQYGRWVFAHNGNIKSFAKYRDELIALVDLSLQKFVLGETDSELIFFILLSHMNKHSDIHLPWKSMSELETAVRQTVSDITAIVGEYCAVDNAENTETFLTFLMTDGNSMIAHQGGKKLFYSTHKKLCSERDTCPYFAHQCENAVQKGQISHLLFSSEPLDGENVWQEMQVGEIISIDTQMILNKS